MYGIGKIFSTKFGGLIFSLISGLAYFIIILDFILHFTQMGGIFLGLVFSPAIICGMALIIFKAVKRMEDEKSYSKINLLMYAHILLMLLSIVFCLDIFKII